MKAKWANRYKISVIYSVKTQVLITWWFLTGLHQGLLEISLEMLLYGIFVYRPKNKYDCFEN